MTLETRTTRAYNSHTREQSTIHTREMLLDAAERLIGQGASGASRISLRRIAEEAGVSAPTAYAHFATLDDLYAAFYPWIRPRIGTTPGPRSLSDFPDLPIKLFKKYERHGKLMRHLLQEPGFNRARAEGLKTRHSEWRKAIAAEMPGLTQKQLQRIALALVVQWSPLTWRWLVDDGGATSAEAARIARWNLTVLIKALKEKPDALDDEGGLFSIIQRRAP